MMDLAKNREVPGPGFYYEQNKNPKITKRPEISFNHTTDRKTGNPEKKKAL